jgi:rubrerythrin
MAGQVFDVHWFIRIMGVPQRRCNLKILFYIKTKLSILKGGPDMEKTIADIIDMAIQREVAAYDFYMDIHHKVQDASVRDTVKFIAKEEIKHKEFLVGYRAGNYGSKSLRMADVVEYKIAEYLEEPEIDSDSRNEDVYLIASHREARSHLFYTELAGMHPDSELKTMLLKMANEELKHKEKMEYLYSNTAFPQTSGG